MIITRIGFTTEWILLSVVAVSLSPLRLKGQLRTDRDICHEIVTTLVPQRVFKKPTTSLQRVEIRSCLPGEAENLQFVAWENAASKPSLVVTTPDEALVQLSMSGGVFVIETSGGSHNTVFVIVYEGGKSFRTGRPRVALQAVTKGLVHITADEKRVSVSYPDLHGEEQRADFSTGME